MSKVKALFLDRDGIINLDTSYLHRQQDFVFIEGIFDLVDIFKLKGYKIFVVTNQSGIGRGYYDNNDFLQLTKWMIGKFKDKQIEISDVKYCPHLPSDDCSCRKPNTGMIDDISSTYDIDLVNSWMVGDKITDIEMSKKAKIGNSVFVGTDETNADYSFKSVMKCKEFLETNKDKIA